MPWLMFLCYAHLPGDHGVQAKASTHSSQGKHLFAIGGERVPPTAAENEEDDEDGGECLSEVCQLDLDANLWFTLPITGKAALCISTAGHVAGSRGSVVSSHCNCLLKPMQATEYQKKNQYVSLRRPNHYLVTGGTLTSNDIRWLQQASLPRLSGALNYVLCHHRTHGNCGGNFRTDCYRQWSTGRMALQRIKTHNTFINRARRNPAGIPTPPSLRSVHRSDRVGVD